MIGGLGPCRGTKPDGSADAGELSYLRKFVPQLWSDCFNECNTDDRCTAVQTVWAGGVQFCKLHAMAVTHVDATVAQHHNIHCYRRMYSPPPPSVPSA